MSATAQPPTPPRTLAFRPSRSADPGVGTTDYELSPSVLLPPSAGPRPADPPPAGFQQQLRLCCLIAALPFGFYAVSAANNVQVFGREALGLGGMAGCLGMMVGLLATAGFLSRWPGRSLVTLRAVEVAVFGGMALFFAYWQFQVLTGVPPLADRAQQETALVAAALVAHLNWAALVAFHGTLVPNTLARGIGAAAGMSAVALLVDALSAYAHAPAGRHAVPLFAVALVLLLAASAFSVFGTAKTQALREEVRTVRDQVRELGQYRLRRRLGLGGMGEVYLAEHRLLKRPCAIKRIHPRYLHHPEQVRRFEREVQATAALRHPNTVEIYDYGRAEDGTYFYVMEYLPGVSLEELVGRHGPQPPERVIHILRQVCGALREAHEHGLVHRDVKPGNILVFPAGTPHDRAKVLDFGLVHSLADQVDPSSKITREGLIVGTPEYMSPEQASGLQLDGRSDLFSLGSVAYFLLTGAEAFHRDNPMKTLLAVVNEPPDPIAKRNPTVPRDLTAVVARCLAKVPVDRYASAAELEVALAGCGCANDWTEERAAFWWDEHPEAIPGTGTDLATLPLRDSQLG
jgi:serine/threonine-protein kinase